MAINSKKKELIITPVDIKESCIKRIDQFCKLLRVKLKDNWIIGQENQNEFDVIIKKFNLESIKKHNKKIPTIYLVYHEQGNDTKAYQNIENLWLLHYPIFSHTLVPLLNTVSKSAKHHFKKSRKTNLTNTFKEKMSLFLKKPFKPKKYNRTADKSAINSKPINPEKQEQHKTYVNNLLKYFKPDNKKHAKIVFLGRPGSGKTTAIAGVSNTPALTTEVKATDHVGLIKSKTTIGIDYGEYQNPNIVLKLYGTPGQQRYDYMRQLVINNVDAYIVLVDLSSENPLHEVLYFNNIIKVNSGLYAKVLYAFTHHDIRKHDPEIIARRMKENSNPPFITIMDPRDKSSVKSVMEKLAHELSNNQFFDNVTYINENQTNSLNN